jgi:hypothetical protein
MSDAALELAYEQDLKRCRADGHDLFAFIVDGLEVLVCARCCARFQETP